MPRLISFLLALLLLSSTTVSVLGQSSTQPQILTRPTSIYRPRSLQVFQESRLRSLQYQESSAEQVEWDVVQINGPDVENLHTLAQLARMSGNAYAIPGEKNWYEIDEAWKINFPVGYEGSEDGFRGRVFLSSDNSTVILSIKDYSLAVARVDISWIFRQVCDCYVPSWRCDNTCLSNALIEDSLFYTVGVNIVNDLLTLYPTSNLWLVGHSLGGALASLLGTTYGLPAVTFESPGERLAAERLHLPLPPHPRPLPPIPPVPSILMQDSQMPLSLSSETNRSLLTPTQSPAIHIYHTADPIPLGTCTGFASPCSQAGYALETKCHLGKSIVFDTVLKLKWKVDLGRHRIKEIVGILEGDEEWVEDEGLSVDDVDDIRDEVRDSIRKHEEGLHGKRKKKEVPEAREEIDCVDCHKWEFGEFK